ncbi:hypothetical protein EDB19DRAFT_30613 [Suillus lakei]|nr:hypothetical protein EDB19DRAFT_30613 [Suillus lakei]
MTILTTDTFTPQMTLAEYEYELALSRATRKAAIQQLHREHNAGITGWYAAFQAQRKEQERAQALRAQLEEQEMEREYRAAAANHCLPHAEPCFSAFWPVCTHSSTNSTSCHLPQSQELSAQATSSTSKPRVKHEHWLNDRHQDRMMAELQSVFNCLSEGTSTAAPSERVPVTSAATSTQANVNDEGTTSQVNGKGKAKEVPDSDTEEEPFVSPAQVASSLSQISSIASRLETLVVGFQFPAELDFSPSRSPSPAYSALDTTDVFALTYTATNAPLRAQEHALSLLLGDLDNVPSFGSHVVRDARRAVVARVEQALEELEKGVEERRGRARARKADPVSVPVEQPVDTSEPENLTSADLAPLEVPIIDEVPTKVVVPEVPPSAASLPTASAEVSETLTAQEVSVPQEEGSEEPLVDEVSAFPVSEGLAGEDAVLVAMEDTITPTHADPTQPSPSSATPQTPPPLDTSDSHAKNTIGVSVPDSTTLTHADGDSPAEVEDTSDIDVDVDVPASFPPAAASSVLGSDHEQTPSEVNVVESDPESYSSVGSPALSSPVSEAEVDTFLLL